MDVIICTAERNYGAESLSATLQLPATHAAVSTLTPNNFFGPHYFSKRSTAITISPTLGPWLSKYGVRGRSIWHPKPINGVSNLPIRSVPCPSREGMPR